MHVARNATAAARPTTCAPAMSVQFDAPPCSGSRLNRAVGSFDREIQRLWDGYGLAA